MLFASPDGMISAHANQSRIGQFSTYNTEVITSKNCISFARSKGWFKGKDKDFNWKMTYAAPDFGGRRWCDARVWSYFNHLRICLIGCLGPWVKTLTQRTCHFGLHLTRR